MDDIVLERILTLMHEHTGVESHSEIELLPDEAAEDVRIYKELVALAELFALDAEETFDLRLQASDPEVQAAWEEVMNSLE